jgi:hypothetical protein
METQVMGWVVLVVGFTVVLFYFQQLHRAMTGALKRAEEFGQTERRPYILNQANVIGQRITDQMTGFAGVVIECVYDKQWAGEWVAHAVNALGTKQSYALTYLEWNHLLQAWTPTRPGQ